MGLHAYNQQPFFPIPKDINHGLRLDDYYSDDWESLLATKQIGLAENMNSESNTADLLIVGHRPQADANGQQPYYLISASANVPGIRGHAAEFCLHTGKVSLEFLAHVDSE